MKRAIGLLITIAFANSVFAAAEIGKPAPDFTATDINGKTHKLSDYKGKIVVLEEYNLDCPFCHNHFKTGAMQELQGEITGKGVIWLLVNSAGRNSPSYRTPEAAKKEWATQKIKATAWIDDSSGELGRKYGMRTTRTCSSSTRMESSPTRGPSIIGLRRKVIRVRPEITCGKPSAN